MVCQRAVYTVWYKKNKKHKILDMTWYKNEAFDGLG